MAKQKKKDVRVLELARRGAKVRLQELVTELKFLVIAFPELKDSFDADELPISFILKQGAARNSSGPKGRRKMSAEARAAASARMRQYWEARRKTEGR